MGAEPPAGPAADEAIRVQVLKGKRPPIFGHGINVQRKLAEKN
jgi:hypothetical protein